MLCFQVFSAAERSNSTNIVIWLLPDLEKTLKKFHFPSPILEWFIKKILSASFFIILASDEPFFQTFPPVLKAPDCLLSSQISFPLLSLHLDAFIFGSNAVKWKCIRGKKEVERVLLSSKTGGPGFFLSFLRRRAPGGLANWVWARGGTRLSGYTGGVKCSPLSTPEIFRFFQQCRFDLAAIDMGKRRE